MTEQPEQRLSANQRYHMVLADIAMAAAIKTFDPDYAIAGGERHAPGSCATLGSRNAATRA